MIDWGDGMTARSSSPLHRFTPLARPKCFIRRGTQATPIHRKTLAIKSPGGMSDRSNPEPLTPRYD